MRMTLLCFFHRPQMLIHHSRVSVNLLHIYDSTLLAKDKTTEHWFQFWTTSRQLCLPRQFTIIGWSVSSRPNMPYRPHLFSYDVSETDMERQAPDTRHQALHIPDTCFVCASICRRHLDFTISWCEDSGCFPPKVSEKAAWNPMVRPSQNDEVLQAIGLTSLSHLLSCRCISLFWHLAWLDDTLANMALQLHINVPLNWPPDGKWHHPPGRPQNKWLDQLRNDSTHSIEDLWRRAVDHEHGGATMHQPSPVTWRWYYTLYYYYISLLPYCLQCSDTVGWASGRAFCL